MPKTYDTVEDWCAAAYRMLDLGSTLIVDVEQREQLHTMRGALALLSNRQATITHAAARAAARIKRCSTCDAPIIWFDTPGGNRAPFDVVDGQKTAINHFTTCPHAKQHRKKAS